LGARGVKQEGWEEIGPIVSTSERGGQEGQTFIHPVIDTALIVGKLLVAMRDTKLVQRPHKPAGAVQQVELVAFTAIDKSAFRLRRLLPSVSTATTGS
jgi:hypothetical protein